MIANFFQRLGISGSLGFCVLIAFFAIALAAPLLTNHSEIEVYNEAVKQPPLSTLETPAGESFFLLGTDDIGRDLYSRIVYGARVSMSIGLAVILISGTLGILLGLLAGSLGGWVDQLIMRFVDLLMALPSMLLALVVVAILGPGLINCVLAISLISLPSICRTLRASVLIEKNKNYVWASKHFGSSWWTTFVKGVLPNCFAPLIVQLTFAFGEGILNAAALGFLGLGAQPPTPEWGTMLADSRAFMESASWLVIWPGFCLFVCVLGVNLFGDGLRAWLLSKGKAARAFYLSIIFLLNTLIADKRLSREFLLNLEKASPSDLSESLDQEKV